jgi:hypothetical protein
MKLLKPCKIKIGDKEYKIIYCKQLEGNLLGEVYYDNNIIKVKFPHPDYFSIFCHEVIHAISHLFDINLKEYQIKRLTRGIRLVLQQNLWFIKFLLKT